MKFYDLKVKKRDNSDLSLSDLKGKVVLVVNTATGCGFTPQYEGLEYLYKKYKDKGFEILDFPCNQFGHQAPGDNDEIHEFCTAKYNTTFDQLNKIDVNGENEDKIFTLLKSEQPKEVVKGFKNKIAMKAIYKISKTRVKDSDISWNFTKFLVDKEGNVVGRYSPTYQPEDMESKIIELLN
jgi:glutathione peroxidase